MKIVTLLCFATASLVAGSPVATKIDGEQDHPKGRLYFEKDLDPREPASKGAKVTVVKYGPYTVPAKDMLDSLWTFNIAKPCTECYIVAMQADLQYADGQSANIDEGAWLHHIVLYNGLGIVPDSKRDLVCSGNIRNFGLPFPHRIFASGNERAAVRLNGNYKYGMQVDATDQFEMLYDLMNQSNETQTYYIQIIYEWVPKSTPGYKPARMVWMDIVGCGDSDTPAQEGYYELKSPDWQSKIGGVMLATVGHAHDGGIFTTLYVNDQPVCKSEQLYGTKPAFIEKEYITNLNSDSQHGTHGLSVKTDNTMLHISEASSCVNFGVLRVGDNIHVRVTYNTTAHSLNVNSHNHSSKKQSTKYSPIMGLNPVYVAEGLMSI